MCERTGRGEGGGGIHIDAYVGMYVYRRTCTCASSAFVHGLRNACLGWRGWVGGGRGGVRPCLHVRSFARAPHLHGPSYVHARTHAHTHACTHARTHAHTHTLSHTHRQTQTHKQASRQAGAAARSEATCTPISWPGVRRRNVRRQREEVLCALCFRARSVCAHCKAKPCHAGTLSRCVPCHGTPCISLTLLLCLSAMQGGTPDALDCIQNRQRRRRPPRPPPVRARTRARTHTHFDRHMRGAVVPAPRTAAHLTRTCHVAAGLPC
jgi:hypothetical protein